MTLPKSWNDIDVIEFKEITELNSIQEVFTREVEVLATLMGVPTSELEDYDISEVSDLLADIKFIKSEPSKAYKHVIDEFTFKPLSKLTVGEFIDIEYFVSKNQIANICQIAAILYRKTTTNEWGELVYEPYKFSPIERAHIFDDYCINDIYGIVPEYLSYRTTFMEQYRPLFQDDSDSQEDDSQPMSSQEAKEIQEEKSAIKWSWERLIYTICNEDLTKFDEVTNLSLVLTFNMLAMKKELSI